MSQSYLVTEGSEIFKSALASGKRIAQKGKNTVYERPTQYGTKHITSFKDGMPFKIVSKSKWSTSVYDKTKGTITTIHKDGDIYTRSVRDAESDALKGFFSIHKNNRNQIDVATFCTPQEAHCGRVTYNWQVPNWYISQSMSLPIKTVFQMHNMAIGNM